MLTACDPCAGKVLLQQDLGSAGALSTSKPRGTLGLKNKIQSVSKLESKLSCRSTTIKVCGNCLCLFDPVPYFNSCTSIIGPALDRWLLSGGTAGSHWVNCICCRPKWDTT
jgi:hypothetical protein